MSSALPQADPCCVASCDDVVVQNIPGPSGNDGADGTDGADGVSAVTTLTVDFTMPAELASDTATVASTAGFVIGENVFVQGLGTLQVTAIGSGVQATLKNLKDTATSAYMSNAAPATIAAMGSRVGMTGLQGASGLLAGAAGGDLKGTYPNPQLLIPNTLGAIVVGNGTDAVALAAGTAGYLPVNDAVTFPATGIGHKQIVPITGDTNVAADRLTRLSSATGTPIAIEASRASLKDPGGLGLLVADDTTGNARGVDAIDFQVTRGVVGATAVASGTQSVISGGQDNIASGDRSVVAGGDNNTAAGNEAVVGGGTQNAVDAKQSVIAGGVLNKIIGVSPNEAAIGGGRSNEITGFGQSVIAGGFTNSVSSQYGSILGGFTNVVSGAYAAIVGGARALADKYAQRAFAAGQFATGGDCQQSDLIWRVSTTGVVGATEMFLDGATGTMRATISTGRTVAFDILLTARSSAGLNAAWTVKGVINNDAGTVTMATAVVNALIADNSGATFGTLANVPIAAADNVNKALVITVQNAAATNVRWTAHGRLLEIGY